MINPAETTAPAPTTRGETRRTLAGRRPTAGTTAAGAAGTPGAGAPAGGDRQRTREGLNSKLQRAGRLILSVMNGALGFAHFQQLVLSVSNLISAT